MSDWAQLLRIVAFMLGSYLLGAEVTEMPVFEDAVGGLINVVTLAIWAYQNNKAKQAK